MTVAIVGGGLSGLAVHHYLREAGVESILFEAAAEPGGVVRSRVVDGRVLDLGPQRTRLSPGIAALVDDLGLRSELREANDVPLYVYHHGALRRVPMDPSTAVTTDLLSMRGKLRVLLEPFAEPPRPDESVEAYLRRSFGEEVARYYFGPLYGGLYGSHPADMPMRHSLSRALASAGIEGSVLTTVLRKVLARRAAPPVVSFDAGLQHLPEALAAEHEASVHLETPVRSVRSEGRQYVVETRTGEAAVDDLVVTTPADVTAEILADVVPESAAALDELTYNPKAVVHLHADAPLTGAGYQMQYDEPLRTLGVTWNASLLDRDGVYTCYLGGSRTPELLGWSDARLGRVAAAEFEQVTGHTARVLRVSRLERGMPAYDESWDALDLVSMPDGVHLCTNYTARAGIPGRIRDARATADAILERDAKPALNPRSTA